MLDINIWNTEFCYKNNLQLKDIEEHRVPYKTNNTQYRNTGFHTQIE